MKLEKDLLIKLCESQNSKRKAALYENYKDFFLMNLTAKFIAEMINADLGSELVNENDIKYCRRHFVGKEQKKDKKQLPPLPKNMPIQKKTDGNQSSEIVWTDPDEVSHNQNKFQSKFLKK